MDKEAVNSSSDDVLRELGLLAKGDLLALRAFCLKIEIAKETSEKNENRLRELKYAIGNNGCVSKVGANKFSSKARTVQLVWKHLNSTGKCYNWSSQGMEVVQGLLKLTRMLLKKSFWKVRNSCFVLKTK